MPSLSPLLSALTRSLGSLVPARPPVRGRRRVPGLKADVRVTYTEGGLPHLDADNATDLLFAQGYLCAADRLFQMDLSRRMARGELAEIMGAREAPWRELTTVFRGMTLVDVDQFVRQLALAPVAAGSIDALSPESRALVEAYAAGVSAYAVEGPAPLECQLLGYRPAPWSAADCALTWKLLAFQLSYGWRMGLVAEALRARFPEDSQKATALLPDQRHLADAMLAPSGDAARALPILEGVAGKHGVSGPGLGGSNAWALGPKRSATGRALLCGDPHLPLRAPAVGWLAHLTGGGLDVAGWCVPGVPGVLMGHNADLAWTFTSGCTLDATWAREEIRDGGRTVRTATGAEPVREETVEIAIRGGGRETRTLRFSGNGPLFGAHLAGLDDTASAYALRWTGHLPTPDLEAVLQLDRATSSSALPAMAGRYGSPTMNLVYADRDGHIGWRLVGLTPRFRPDQATAGAVPGWSEAHEWLGVEPPEALPSLEDPDDGLVASANQRVVPDGSVLQLGDLFEPPYRARRIRTLFGGTRTVTLDEAQQAQWDVESGFGLAFRDAFVQPLRARLADAALSKDARAVLDAAAGWRGHAEVASRGAAAAWAFFGALVRRLFEPALGERLFEALFEQHNLPLMPVLRVLEADGAPFVTAGALEAAAVESLETAAQMLRAKCGGGPSQWRLGALRTVTMAHALSEVPALGRLFTIGPFPGRGDGTTLSNASFRVAGEGAADVGPVFRHAVEVGAWDDYRVVLATGEGGDPSNGRYREHVAKWRKGSWFRFPFTRAAIDAAAQDSAVLERGI